VQVIDMEACSGAHFQGRALREQGARGAADAGLVRQALCANQRGRLHRCRGNC
jgi:hypothetical protein